MESEIKQWGNSKAFVIPKEYAECNDLDVGDRVEILVVKKERVDGFGIAKGARPFKRDPKDFDRY
jgi:bifunctional DNA-binding transcriptional regulator/antitoxin component of YhaV-PrlF toxin-antitoxin module